MIEVRWALAAVSLRKWWLVTALRGGCCGYKCGPKLCISPSEIPDPPSNVLEAMFR